MQNNYLLFVWEKDGSEIFSEFVKPVNNFEAIIDNLTHKSRVTLNRGIDKRGKQFISHKGYILYKQNK